MSILLLLLILLLGLGGGDVVASETVATPTRMEVKEAPPLPPTAGQADETVAAPSADAEPAVARQAWPNPDVIVDTADVAAGLADARIKLVALTPMDDYLAGHIPGALQVDWKPFEIVETGDQQVATWRADVEAILTDLGIAPGDTVVVYDGGTFYASRLWWVLHQLGHHDVRILDGGLPAWEAAGLPVETRPAVPEPTLEGGAYVGTPDEAAIATIAEVEAALDDPSVVLVDARTPEEYAAGHIPGAVNIPFTDNAADGSGGRWKSPDELRRMYAAAGITPDKTVVPYCLTGVRSAATYVTLTALAYPDVSLFTGSWAEWSADPTRPVEV